MRRCVTFQRNYADLELEDLFVSENVSSKMIPRESIQQITRRINGGAVCIAASQCTEVVEKLCTGIGGEIRQYILLSNDAKISRILGPRYIRITKIPQSGMLVVHIAEDAVAGCWLFPNDDSKEAWVVGEDQQELLYRSFCNLFWNCGEGAVEYRGTKDRVAAEKPINQEIHITNPCSMPGSIDDILDEFSGGVFYSGSTSFHPITKFSDVILADGENISAGVVHEYEHIGLFEPPAGGAFSAVMKGGRGYLLPSILGSESANWSIPLNGGGCDQIKSCYMALWRHESGVCVGGLVGRKVRFRSSMNNTIEIKDQDQISEDYFAVSDEEYLSNDLIIEKYLRGCEKKIPSAVDVQYHLTVFPPKLPKGAKKDTLYNDWNKIQHEWDEALEKLVIDSEKYYGALPDGREKVALKNKRNNMVNEIDSLRSNMGILSPNTRNSKIEKYKELCAQFEQYRVECDESVQRNEFEDGRRTFIEQKGVEIERATAELNVLKQELGDLEGKKGNKVERKRGKCKSKIETKVKEIQNMDEDLREKQEELFVYKQSPLHSRNVIRPVLFEFPLEQLPSYNSAILYSYSGVRYLAIPDSADNGAIEDDGLRDDANRLGAKIVVRDSDE